MTWRARLNLSVLQTLGFLSFYNCYTASYKPPYYYLVKLADPLKAIFIWAKSRYLLHCVRSMRALSEGRCPFVRRSAARSFSRCVFVRRFVLVVRQTMIPLQPWQKKRKQNNKQKITLMLHDEDSFAKRIIAESTDPRQYRPIPSSRSYQIIPSKARYDLDCSESIAGLSKRGTQAGFVWSGERGARAYNGALGAPTQRGPGAESPVGARGDAPWSWMLFLFCVYKGSHICPITDIGQSHWFKKAAVSHSGSEA